MGILSQLLMSTFCSDGLIRESVNVGQAAFSGPWYIFSMNKVGRALRQDVLMIIIRSRKSCCLTAGGFFPVSLETCTAVNTQLSKSTTCNKIQRFAFQVLSTAMSYFTLLRHSAPDLINT